MIEILIGVAVVAAVILWGVINRQANEFNEAYNPVAIANGLDDCHEMARTLGFRNMVEYENMFKSHGTKDKQKIAESLAYDYDLKIVRGLSGEELEKQAKYDAHVQMICDTTGLKKTQWESLSEQEQKDMLNSPKYIKQHLEFMERVAQNSA
ncbi:hypothetical protein [Colwellia sp. MB3u-4]|jgi:hypothetical protein|uniref:hypothetical protein n=1 Tax=Colwellia sp. MB3u-4 TaxID=2759822 RepID=UPI0015F41C48|nr:hypothetical protein [Colwellia sp. MB3u-4]MBA6287475.1 hypothetical protein [Colwellia sp. MB3u-4]